MIKDLFSFRGAAVLVALAICAPAAHTQEAKHILLFIGDGMQLQAEMAASRYLFGKDDGLSFHKLPYQGNVATWDVTTYDHWAGAGAKYDEAAVHPLCGYDPLRGGFLPFPLQTSGIDGEYLRAQATDSASAATAWATGRKTDAGNISWLAGDPPNGQLKTIAEILRDEKGFSIGVVSTVPFTHATPAAHVSHNVSRANYRQIADEIVTKVQPDVVIGGGYNHKTYVSSTALAYLQPASSPYVFVERRRGVDGSKVLLAAAAKAHGEGKKLFGLFGSPSGGNFESPQPRDRPGRPQVDRATIENPLLKDAVLAALKVLSGNPRGFFVMFEQGDIDWAAHAKDYRRIVGTTWDLHEAVKTAIEYVDRPGDGITWKNTLLVVTADHANSYLRLEKPLGRGELPSQTGVADDHVYAGGEVSFGSWAKPEANHTNELVRLYARGAGIVHLRRAEGKWYPCTSIIDNTQLFHAMLEAAGRPQPSRLTIVPSDATCQAAPHVSGTP